MATPLSPRQQQVLALVVRGMTNEQIARHLGIGQRTVETHRALLMKKLNLRSTIELVRYALRSGVLDNEGNAGELS